MPGRISWQVDADVEDRVAGVRNALKSALRGRPGPWAVRVTAGPRGTLRVELRGPRSMSVGSVRPDGQATDLRTEVAKLVPDAES